MTPDAESPDASRPGLRLDRRTLIGGATGAVAGAAGIAALGSSVFAQDATPAPAEASPAASPAAQDPNAVGSDRFPVRTELGPAVPPEYTDDETNWPSENANLSSTREAVGSTISSETINQLGLGWSFPVPISAAYGALVASPAIVGDMVYQQDAMSNVYALNRDTGEQVWTNEYNEAVPSGGPNGVAAGYGFVVYTLGGPADVIAVKADSGEEVWRTNIRGFRHEGITMAPLIHDSTVYVSTIPGTADAFYEGNQRGFIIALDLVDGQVLWYFDTTVDNLWGADGGNARINSGGGLWHPPSVSEDGGLFVGIGNASPYPGVTEFPAATSRPGDNDYANSIIRIDTDRAAVDWFVNVKPHDLFDLDNQLSPVLTTATIDGAEKKIAISSGKHGIVVAFDQETGEEYWRTPVGEHKNDDLQELPDDEYVEVLPGTLGGTETPMASANGLVFAPVFHMPSFYNSTGLDFATFDFTTSTGNLVALDVNTGEIVWQADLPTGVLGGATVTNDIVFTGGLDGLVRGFKTDDGTQVFTYQTASGLNAPLAASGDYLFVPSGGPLIPSVDSWDPAPAPAAALIALKIGGEVQTAPTGTPAAGEATPETASGTPSTGQAGGVTVSTVDLAFEPKVLTIPTNTDVVITITNNGALQHDFYIDELGIQSDLLDAGASTTVTVNAAPGSYEYYCSVTGHKQAGMVGTLTVE